MPRVKLFDQTAVLTKAMELFWKNGYHATSMQQLVDHLGINRGSIYDTYGGKQQLFNQAFELYRKQNKENIDLFFANQESVKQGFRTLLERAVSETIGDCDRKGCFVVNTISEFVPGDDELKKVIQENQTIFEHAFLVFLQKGVANNEISSDKNLQQLASFLFTTFNGLKVLAKIQDDPAHLKGVINQALTVLD